jgi:transcriptional regulator with XRE-family HTH domain
VDISEILRRAEARNLALPSPPLRRALREEKALTQADVAQVLGVDRATVARYELGTRSPRGDIRRRYAEVLAELARR